MNLNHHPSPESIEAYLNGVLFGQNPSVSGTAGAIEDHLLVCGSCQEAAENETLFTSLIRQCVVANEPGLSRRSSDFS